MIVSEAKIEELKNQLSALHSSSRTGRRSIGERTPAGSRQRARPPPGRTIGHQGPVGFLPDPKSMQCRCGRSKSAVSLAIMRRPATTIGLCWRSTTPRAWRANSNRGRTLRGLKYSTPRRRRSILLLRTGRCCGACRRCLRWRADSSSRTLRESMDSSVKTEADLLKMLPTDVELLGLISQHLFQPITVCPRARVSGRLNQTVASERRFMTPKFMTTDDRDSETGVLASAAYPADRQCSSAEVTGALSLCTTSTARSAEEYRRIISRLVSQHPWRRDS